MGDFLQSFAMTYAALFPIANPLGNAAIFLSITDGEKSVLRRSQALKGSLYMPGILLLFFVGGNFIMRFFGIPLLAGSGSMAVVMSLSSYHPTVLHSGMGGIVAGILAVCATCWLTVREAELVLRVLGVNDANALTKIMAFLLLAIGVQLTLNGAQDWLTAILKK